MFRRRFFIVLLFLVIAAALQIASPSVVGFSGDFVIAALVVASFFLSIGEVAVLALAALFLLNWHPGAGREEIFLFAFPVLYAFLRPALPLEPRLTNIAAIAVGIVAFYALLHQADLFREAGVVLLDVLAGVVFGAVAFQILYGLYRDETARPFGFRNGFLRS